MLSIDFKNKLRAKENSVVTFLLISFLMVYGYFYFFAVTDLSKNAYWLFMDERISYDGILKIYRPTSFQSFLDSVFFGGDLRYGRLFWNLNALISYIPYLIFGEQGQIIATRISQMIFLFLAYYFLIKTFIENRFYQLFAFFVLTTLPNTAYFIIEPKPEPLQLFFLSLFLMYAFKNNWKIRPYIILLGISLGLKISLIPISFILILCFLYLNRNDVFFKRAYSKLYFYAIPIISSILFSFVFLKFVEGKIVDLLGVNSIYYPKIIARPALNKLASSFVSFSTKTSLPFKYLILISICFFVVSFFLFVYRNVSNNTLKLFLFGLIGVIICTPCIMLIPINFKYLGYLIANNKLDHGADNVAVNYMSWINFTLFEIFKVPFWIIISIVILPITSFLFMSFKFKNKQFIFKGLILLCLILLSTIPIFLNVKRLWSHYLHIGFVVIVIFYFYNLKYFKNRFVSFSLLLIPILMFLYGTNQTFIHFNDYSNRTKKADFYQLDTEYNNTISLLNKIDIENKNIIWDPTLFFPDRLKSGFLTINYVYEFNQLSYTNPDIIILNANSNLYSELNKFKFIISNNQFELIDINSKIYKVFKKVN